MRTSSCKAKGRRCAAEVKELLLKEGRLDEENILITPSGCTGEDVILSPLARNIFPFTFECKNVEKINIWDSLHQAESHKKADRIPLLFFKRNRSKLFVALDAEEFIKIVVKNGLSL